jgi:hypothetical protein
MKQNPPTFVQEYSDCRNDNVSDGFVPYRKNKEYIHSLFVEMIAYKWMCGAMLILNVYECVNGHKKIDPLLNKVAYTNHSHQAEDDHLYIMPTLEQERLITALSSGDLRGKYAEEIALSLYTDLFVLNPKGGLKDILPKVVKTWEERYVKFGWERKSK